MNQSFDDPLVPLIKTIAIDLKHSERAIGQLGRDFPVRFHLHIIADPAE